jgi:hypothetical protein
MVKVVLDMTSKTKKRTVSKTVSKKLPERVAEGTIPLGALQRLAELSETLQKLRPSGDPQAPVPMIILTSTGLELRFTGAEPAKPTAHEAAAPEPGMKSVLRRVSQVEEGLEPLLKRIARAERAPGISPARLERIEEELKALRESTAALHEAMAKDSRSIAKTLESHSAAISSVRAAISQNEDLVEGIVETLHMLNGMPGDSSDELGEEALAVAS